MRNLDTLSGQLSEVRSELAHLSTSIPMFSSWRLPELGRVVERYAEILLWLDGIEIYHDVCSELLDSLADIRANVQAVNETQDWRPYNHAKIVLQLDMAELMAVLPD